METLGISTWTHGFYLSSLRKHLTSWKQNWTSSCSFSRQSMLIKIKKWKNKYLRTKMSRQVLLNQFQESQLLVFNEEQKPVTHRNVIAWDLSPLRFSSLESLNLKHSNKRVLSACRFCPVFAYKICLWSLLTHCLFNFCDFDLNHCCK